MARLVERVRAILLDEGSSAASLAQHVGNALYALAVLSNLGVCVEACTIQGLVRRAAGMQLLLKGHRQVCAHSSC
jgi:hypothetical protein